MEDGRGVKRKSTGAGLKRFPEGSLNELLGTASQFPTKKRHDVPEVRRNLVQARVMQRSVGV